MPKAKTNRKEYCERMRDNAFRTTKSLIPQIVGRYDSWKILDVGCADGALTKLVAQACPNATIIAIDCSPEMIKEAKRKNSMPNIQYEVGELDSISGKFDTVILSSVLHEISSYHEDKSMRYSKEPILRALDAVKSHLASGGRVIIRDMIRPESGIDNVTVKFNTSEAMNDFFKFVTAVPYYMNCDSCKFTAEGDHFGMAFKMKEILLMEYLMTCTWGSESFQREVQERKFIFPLDGWVTALHSAGLQIDSFIATNEDYPRYFRCLVSVVSPDDYEFQATTCLIVASSTD